MKNCVLLSLLLHGTAIAVGVAGWTAQRPSPAVRVPFQVSLSAVPAPLVQPQPDPPQPVEPEPEGVPIEVDTLELDAVQFERSQPRRAVLPVHTPTMQLSRRLPRPLRVSRPAPDRVVEERPAPTPAPVTAAVTAPAAHVDSAPEPKSCTPPPYPALARRLGQEGTVKIRLTIDSKGAVIRAEIHKSSGSRILDGAALRAVRGWTYRPATRNGESIAGELIQPVVFRLG